MKDHSLNFDDSKKFILSYKIENGKIIAKLASKELYIIPYSEENENKIISRMELQAKRAKNKPIDFLDKFLAVTQTIILPFAIINLINNGGLFYALVLIYATGSSIYYSTKIIKNLIKKYDIKKLKYFLNAGDEINRNLEKNDNMKLGISQNAIKEIELQQSENKKPFNINNIDNYSLRDLKILKENIERISSFGFDEEESITEEKGPILKKKL